jgi:hypothetical protein
MRQVISFLICITCIYSCKKSGVDLPEDKGCIERLIIPVNSQGTMPAVDFSLVKTLFTSNGINNPNYRYSRTYRDSVKTFNGTYDYRNVYIIQYANGLPIFGESLNYLFKNGTFSSYAGAVSNGTSLNTVPLLTLGQLRKLFIGDLQLFDHRGNEFKDSCLKAEFGYFNLNSGTGNTTENIVKAWHITPKNGDYPEAYYQDSDGGFILYFNGMEYGHR